MDWIMACHVCLFAQVLLWNYFVLVLTKGLDPEKADVLSFKMTWHHLTHQWNQNKRKHCPLPPKKKRNQNLTPE